MTSAKTKAKRQKSSPSSNTIPGIPFARDFTKSPYTDDEKRIVNWLHKISGQTVGGGDDPIGFFMSSYEMLIAERKDMKLQINALKLDNDRLYSISANRQDESELVDDAYTRGQLDAEDAYKNDESGC